MLISPNLYSPRYLDRFRYAQIAAVAIAVAACGYLVVTTLSEVGHVWEARQVLARDITEAQALRREAARLSKDEAARRPIRSGGVDSFAVTFSAWARQRRVTVESMVPEGVPVTTEINVGDSKLGLWSANEVRIRGRGAFANVMDLLKQFRGPDTPVRLESFSFQSFDSGAETEVSFDLLLTVYERKSGVI